MILMQELLRGYTIYKAKKNGMIFLKKKDKFRVHASEFARFHRGDQSAADFGVKDLSGLRSR